MANLLNAIQLTNKAQTAPATNSPVPEVSKDAGELFEKALNESMESGSVALAMNSIQQPVQNQISLESNPEITSEVPQNEKGNGIRNTAKSSENPVIENTAATVISGMNIPVQTNPVSGTIVPDRSEAQRSVTKRTEVLSAVNSQVPQLKSSPTTLLKPTVQKALKEEISNPLQQSRDSAQSNRTIVLDMNRSFEKSIGNGNSAVDSSLKLEGMDWQIKDQGDWSEEGDFVQAKELFNGKDGLQIVDLRKEPLKAASSKLSTNEFLNLRNISLNSSKATPVQAGIAKVKSKDEKHSKFDELMTSMAPANSQIRPHHQPVVNLDATVSQMPGQKMVLSPESMNQIASQVNLLGQARQDGEIKIRLRPDHLGELQMNVRTIGQNVTVQIKAQSEEAKKMIEESISSLKDHLSTHQLSLASIDVVTQPALAQNADQGSMQFDSNSGFNQFSNQGGGNSYQEEGRQSGPEYFQENASFVKPQSSPISRPRVSDSSRLDMIA